MFLILTVVMISCVCVYISHIVFFKYMQFIVCQLYLNKAAKYWGGKVIK